jgi:predicted metal-dependent phosphoesterase TrpH
MVPWEIHSLRGGAHEDDELMRADLHVHSLHSGPATLPGLAGVARECYSTPLEVYGAALRRGMDLVTLTDHDTISGALELVARLPRTFVSEEVTCTLPEGRELHLGVFDLDEPQHEGISRRRRDAEALFAYLAEQRLPVSANHLFSALTGKRATADIHLALRGSTLVESMNGAMPGSSNRWAGSAGRHAGRPLVGGSDSHTLAGVASAYTEVPGARTRTEFLDGLRRGFTVPAGRSGTYFRLTAEITRIMSGAVRENVRTAWQPGGLRRLALTLGALLAAPVVPLVTAAVYVDDLLFAQRHGRRFLATLGSGERAAEAGLSLPAEEAA